MARLLGIPAHVLRFYEERGVVSPAKNWENEYRYYDNVDAGRVLQCKLYRSLDFSVGEAADLVGKKTPTEIRAAFRRRREEAGVERRRMERIERELERSLLELEELDSFRAGRRDGHLVEREGFVRISTGPVTGFSMDASSARIAERWLEYLPSVRFLGVVPQSAAHGESPLVSTWGYAISETDAAEFGERRADGIEYYPPAQCLRSFIEKYDGNDFSSGHFQPLIDSARSAGLRSAAEPATLRLVEIDDYGDRQRFTFLAELPVIDAV